MDTYSNSNPSQWLKLCADLEHEAAGDLAPITEHGPLEPENPRLSGCDCCGLMRVCQPAFHPSIETYACAECRGGTLCEICLDDIDCCDCSAIYEDDKREFDEEPRLVQNCQTGAWERDL